MFLSLSFLIVRALGFSLILRRSPVVLNIFILFLSLVVSFIIGLTVFSWLGYIIFLIYVSGILIIFIYFSAIQPNQRLYFKSLFLSAVFFFFFTPLYLYPIVIDLFLDEEEDLIHISFCVWRV